MTDQQQRSVGYGFLLGTIGMCMFALTLPMTHLALPYFDPLFIGFGRSVVAAPLAGILLLLFANRIPTRNQFKSLLIVASGVVIGFPMLSAYAMQTVPASHGGVVLGFLPLATACFAVIYGSERPAMWFWLIGLIGAILVTTFSLSENSGQLVWGDLLLFIAVLIAALGYAFGGFLSKQMPGWQVICWALVISGPITLPMAFAFRPETIADVSWSGGLSFFYLALFSQLIGFFFWYEGLAVGGVARVSQVQLLQPFVTIFASMLLLFEPLKASTLIFAALVVGCVFASRYARITDVK
ncbi:MAG: DMT family transporter [Pseudomonadota bacterium]